MTLALHRLHCGVFAKRATVYVISTINQRTGQTYWYAGGGEWSERQDAAFVFETYSHAARSQRMYILGNSTISEGI